MDEARVHELIGHRPGCSARPCHRSRPGSSASSTSPMSKVPVRPRWTPALRPIPSESPTSTTTTEFGFRTPYPAVAGPWRVVAPISLRARCDCSAGPTVMRRSSKSSGQRLHEVQSLAECEVPFPAGRQFPLLALWDPDQARTSAVGRSIYLSGGQYAGAPAAAAVWRRLQGRCNSPRKSGSAAGSLSGPPPRVARRPPDERLRVRSPPFALFGKLGLGEWRSCASVRGPG